MTEQLYRLVKSNMLKIAETSDIGNDKYLVPKQLQKGLFLKRLLSFYPQGIPFTKLERKWVEFEFDERMRRDKKIMDKDKIEPPSEIVYDLNNLVINYYPFARIRYFGDDDPRQFDMNKVMLYPKFDPEQLKEMRGLNVKGKINGYRVMYLEDKLDFVLSRFSSEKGINICEFIDQYELIIGRPLPTGYQSIFDLLSQYHIYFDIKEPVILTIICPNIFDTKLHDILKENESNGIYDDELDSKWKDKYDQDINFNNDSSFKRAMILHDRFYRFLRIKLDTENEKIKYEYREQLMEDNQKVSDSLGSGEKFNFLSTVRDTLYQYEKENKTAIPLIEYIDWY